MNILGITWKESGNTAACLLKDGKLVAMAEEERFNRIKHGGNVNPTEAILFCLSDNGLKPEDIDLVAVGWSFYDGAVEEYSCMTDDRLEWSRESWKEQEKELIEIGLECPKVTYSHHLCHMASTFFCSGFGHANILSVDASGEDCSGLIAYSEGMFSHPNSTMVSSQMSPNKIFNINCIESWGLLWEDVTQLLGFKRHSGEGKTMGLACYGDKVDETILPKLFDKESGAPLINEYRSWFASKYNLVPAQNVPRDYSATIEPLSYTGKNLAFTLQSYYSEWLVNVSKQMYEDTGCKNFCLAGGTALNCTANGKLAEQSFVDNIYIQPASHDAGVSIGAATLAHYYNQGLNLPEVRMNHAYWGKQFSSEEIEKELKVSLPSSLSYEAVDAPKKTADLLSEDKVVCFFQGRAEAGPRALGNRSILANPCHKENLDRVNKIKGREFWRPLAPSILEEDYFDVVDLRHKSPFMLMAAQVKEKYRPLIPAVVHVDNSCRPQTVSKETNPTFHQTILEFKKNSGIPVVLNTSYNLSHEPIVNSPQDAVRTFLASGADALVIGDFVVEKNI